MRTSIAEKPVPTNPVERETLREKGQFWTPPWVAEAMVAYIVQGADEIFDPGVGRGAFYSALKTVADDIKFYGTDIDPAIVREAHLGGIFDDRSTIEIRDFILNPPRRKFDAIVANPPYIRHHRLAPEMKAEFRRIGLRHMGFMLDGRAGLHIYFLIQALGLLARDGRLAFIMPADTCEGVFARSLWNWIGQRFHIEGVVAFDHKATPFPGVDTNAMIFLIKNAPPHKQLYWIKCTEPGTKELFKVLSGQFEAGVYDDLEISERELSEALATGLSRPPRASNFEYTLADFASVMRGIATGANEFFFLTERRAKELGIPENFLLPAVGRTRDIDDICITEDTLYALEQKGRPTRLFSPNGSRLAEMPSSVQDYIREGVDAGFPERALISTRNPWYRMEVREKPPFLFAYLGRRNARFIRNEAGIVPLTAFLCVYPHSNAPDYVEKFWEMVQNPAVLANLRLVGKSYGSGAIKVEPRALERLPISSEVVQKIGITPLWRD